MTVEIEDYTVGRLAYVDSFNGLIPCKTLSVRERTDSFAQISRQVVTVKVTADRPGFKRGEVIEDAESRTIVPRDRVRGKLIRTGWRWIEPITIEYRAWCENGDLLHWVELPENASPAQRQAARDECEAKIRDSIAQDAKAGHDDSRDAYHVQVCIGDQDMTGHELSTTGDY